MRLGVDLGTSSVKVMLTTRDGTVRAAASRSCPVSSPTPGVAETQPVQWLEAIRDAARELAEKAGGLSRVEAIGLSGQMHGIVAIDRQGEVLRPAILWADNRGAEFLGRFEAVPRALQKRLMNAPNSGMSALSMLWLKAYQESIYDRTFLFLHPKDYVRYVLTGTLATDPTDASGSLLYDFYARTWSRDLCGLLGLHVGKLPPILPSLSLAGHLSAEGADLLGIPRGVAVAVGAGDTPAALYGSACFSSAQGRPTMIQISVGTGIQVVQPTSDLPDFDPSLNYFESVIAGEGYRMAAMLNGGLALERVREWLGLEWDSFYAELASKNLRVPDDLVFVPYLCGERTPYRNPNARGAWVGLGLHHTRHDLMTAALFGVACSVRLGLERLGVPSPCRLRLAGGSARYRAWTTLLASVLAHPLEVLDVPDASARGATAIAGALLGDPMPAPMPATVVTPVEIQGLERRYRRFLDTYAALYSA